MTSMVLASASASRQQMLRAAAVPFVIDPSSIDENRVKQSMATAATVGDIAARLASAKAEDVVVRHPGAFVIGSDQMLTCDGRCFDKPRSRTEARDQLLALRGRLHVLTAAVVVQCGNECLWKHIDEARLTMRPFSEVFLDGYLDRAGDAVLSSVGAYQIEGLGAQLFERIEGDVFTIMGMPLLPLLAFLRSQGVIPA
ncbi:MAG TPA: Maf family protein [Alphaproteobacteria bacterium]|jgi:septum formation protein|nr:Maf family protein [Alphaproteobacteria bacterium]